MPTTAPTSATSAPLAGIYARVSTLRQGEDEKTSLHVQEDECRAFAPTAGLAVDEACVAREPFTATTIHRPALDRLLASMVQRGVRHLIMDKADRVTREGQVVAAVFLQDLLERGITLHLALERLTLDNDTSVMAFLTMAFAAKKDNEYRVANVQRNRREAARQLGRYARGRHAPYGWQYAPREVDGKGHVINFRLVHDPATYPILQRILAAALRGEGEWKIACDLTADAIPTPDEAAGQGKGRQATSAGKKLPWRHQTVARIIENPLNAGLVRSFRTKRTAMPPDATHPRRWYKNVPVPAAEQVLLPTDVVLDPPLTSEQYQRLVPAGARERERAAQTRRYDRQPDRTEGSNLLPTVDDPAPPPALLAGGLLTHAGCGGRLRVKRTRRRGPAGDHLYDYYACKLHEDVPSACPAGLHVAVEHVDALVWAALRRLLLTPGRLEQLAEAQRAADLAALERDEGPSSRRHLEQVRAALVEQRANLADSIARTESAFVRATLEEKLIKLEPDLAEADERLAELHVVAADEERRRAVLADVRRQLGQYTHLLVSLNARPRAQRVPIQRRILRALGFGGTLRVEAVAGEGTVPASVAQLAKRARRTKPVKRLIVEAELRLADGVATEPWLVDQMPALAGLPADFWTTWANALPNVRALEALDRYEAAGGAEVVQRDLDVDEWLRLDTEPGPDGHGREVYVTDDGAGTVVFVPSAPSSR